MKVVNELIGRHEKLIKAAHESLSEAISMLTTAKEIENLLQNSNLEGTAQHLVDMHLKKMSDDDDKR